MNMIEVGNRYMELCDVAPNDAQAFEEMIGMFAENVQANVEHLGAPEEVLHGRKALTGMYMSWFQAGPQFKHLWNVTQISDSTIEMPYVFVLRQPDGELSVAGGTDYFAFDDRGLIVRLRNERKFIIGL